MSGPRVPKNLNSQDGGKIFTSEEDTMGSRMVMVTNKGHNAYCINLNNNQPQNNRYTIVLSDRRGYRHSITEIMTTSNNELKQGEVPGKGFMRGGRTVQRIIGKTGHGQKQDGKKMEMTTASMDELGWEEGRDRKNGKKGKQTGGEHRDGHGGRGEGTEIGEKEILVAGSQKLDAARAGEDGKFGWGIARTVEEGEDFLKAMVSVQLNHKWQKGNEKKMKEHGSCNMLMDWGSLTDKRAKQVRANLVSISGKLADMRRKRKTENGGKDPNEQVDALGYLEMLMAT
jgi:hypothetical protein